MKTKELFVFMGAVVFSVSVFAKMNKEKQIRDLIFENVEALSENEPVGGYEGDKVYYYWNDQHWEGERDGSTGNWFPEYDTCRLYGLDGHQVHCTQGSGNCWNGKDCIYD